MTNALAITEEQKKKLNHKLKNEFYAGAIKMYTKAIESCPYLTITPEDILHGRDSFDKKRPANVMVYAIAKIQAVCL